MTHEQFESMRVNKYTMVKAYGGVYHLKGVNWETGTITLCVRADRQYPFYAHFSQCELYDQPLVTITSTTQQP